MLNQEVEPIKEEGVKVTAKEYLLQIKEQKQNIRKQEEYIQRLRDSLTIAGISYDKERIQSSPDPDKFAKIFGQIDEEEQRLEDMKTRFVNTRVKIINQIHQLTEEKHQNVLYLVYVDDKTLKKASQEMCFSYEYVKELHGAALQAFDLMFPPQSA
jgi:DNA-directed RNA polymerase specialized sigma subunit